MDKKPRNKFLLQLMTAAFLLPVGGLWANSGPAPEDPVEVAQYRVLLQTEWTRSRLPVDYPSNPHFSPLVGVAHDASYSLLAKGHLATPGLEDLAETGATQTLVAELREEQGIRSNISSFHVGRGILSGVGSSELSIEVSEQYPLITVLTMIAPSPDWVIGVSALPLFKSGEFVDRLEIPLYAIDAGTDSGSSFASRDRNTSPQEPIHLLSEGTLFVQNNSLQPFGRLIVERLN